MASLPKSLVMSKLVSIPSLNEILEPELTPSRLSILESDLVQTEDTASLLVSIHLGTTP